MSEILSYCESLPEKRFASGDVLLSEGNTDGALYILLEGAFSIEKNGIEVARVSEPGAVFGEMSVLLQVPISATVTAKTDARVRICQDPLPFLLSNPAIALHTAKLLAGRLQNATSYLADLKRQFEDYSDHFGMVDEVLGAMIEQQPRARTQEKKSDDPRV